MDDMTRKHNICSTEEQIMDMVNTVTSHMMKVLQASPERNESERVAAGSACNNCIDSTTDNSDDDTKRALIYTQ